MAEKRTPAAEATWSRMPQTQLYEDLGPGIGSAVTCTI
jgi:hypothetical protein